MGENNHFVPEVSVLTSKAKLFIHFGKPQQ